ncbi:hypothetical protein JST97_09640 [bacterium]|nr:hypothetical protein [bacterium]
MKKILLLLALGASAWAKPAEVQFPLPEVVEGQAEADRDGLRQAIQNYWQAYLDEDSPRLLASLQPDVTRMCKQAGPAQHGRDQVARQITDEWSAFERKQGKIATCFRIRQASLHRQGKSAYASYWLESKGGDRWDYSDQALIFQTLVHTREGWQISHQIESWSLDYDLDQQSPGTPTLEFDYVYPVAHLPRALKYYQPVMGQPEWVNDRAASFNLGGPRFQLRVDPLEGKASCRPGFPSGYAVFYVSDLMTLQQRLKRTNTPFLLGTQTRPLYQGPDPYLVVADPSGNLAVLMERRFVKAKDGLPPQVNGFEGKNPYEQAAGRVARAWMATSEQQLQALVRPDCRWFDDRRTRVLGQQKDRSATLEVLKSAYWTRYDRGPQGVEARLSARDIRVSPQPDGALVTYQARLTGLGRHPFGESFLVVQRFDRQLRLAESYMVANDKPSGLVRDLDYTGYPVTDLKSAGDFYSKLLQLERYEDTDYLGWWSNFAVFGIYKARLSEDELPLSGRSNGYASFWVASAEQALRHAQKHGGRFPVIPAINSSSGISREPGYRQLYTTDSECNGLLFTEYRR